MIERKDPQETTTSNNEEQQQMIDDKTNSQGSTHNHLDDSTIYDNMIFPS